MARRAVVDLRARQSPSFPASTVSEGPIDTASVTFRPVLAIRGRSAECLARMWVPHGGPVDPFLDNGYLNSLTGRVDFTVSRASLAPSLVARSGPRAHCGRRQQVAFEDV